MNALIRLLYALLIAGVTTAFVAVGIYSFYQPSKGPAYPTTTAITAPYGTPDYQRQEAAHNAEYNQYQQKRDAHDKEMKTYQRNFTLALLPLVAVVMVAGLWFFERSEVIGEGLGLAALAIAVYAIVTASIADNRILRFIAVTLLLASTLLLTYRRFLSNHHTSKS